MGLKDILKMSAGRVTPEVSGYLLRCDGDVRAVSPHVQKRIVELITSSSVEPKNRSGHWHPSQLSKCLRRQSFEYHDYPIQWKVAPQQANLFADGHFRHLKWQILLLETGLATDVEVPAIMDEYNLRGSIDGVGDDCIFEIKGTRFISEVKKHGILDGHLDQAHGYLLATGASKVVFIYEDKQSQEWVEIEAERDDDLADELEDRLVTLNAYADADKLPPPLPEESEECRWCPYKEICPTAPMPG